MSSFVLPYLYPAGVILSSSWIIRWTNTAGYFVELNLLVPLFIIVVCSTIIIHSRLWCQFSWLIHHSTTWKCRHYRGPHATSEVTQPLPAARIWIQSDSLLCNYLLIVNILTWNLRHYKHWTRDSRTRDLMTIGQETQGLETWVPSILRVVLLVAVEIAVSFALKHRNQ